MNNKLNLQQLEQHLLSALRSEISQSLTNWLQKNVS